jgi:hypothetical protein
VSAARRFAIKEDALTSLIRVAALALSLAAVSAAPALAVEAPAHIGAQAVHDVAPNVHLSKRDAGVLLDMESQLREGQAWLLSWTRKDGVEFSLAVLSCGHGKRLWGTFVDVGDYTDVVLSEEPFPEEACVNE